MSFSVILSNSLVDIPNMRMVMKNVSTSGYFIIHTYTYTPSYTKHTRA